MNQMNVQDSGYQTYYAPSGISPNQTQNNHEQRQPSPAPQSQPPYQPPPAYPVAHTPVAQPLAHATAMYVYSGTDAGDLNLMVNDRVAVTEYMNTEWWKGRSERTGQEGIFPRSYVRVEEKMQPPPPQQMQMQNNYGNMPMAVAQGSGPEPSQTPSKYGAMGKRAGAKIGNAALFLSSLLDSYAANEANLLVGRWSIHRLEYSQQHLLACFSLARCVATGLSPTVMNLVLTRAVLLHEFSRFCTTTDLALSSSCHL